MYILDPQWGVLIHSSAFSDLGLWAILGGSTVEGRAGITATEYMTRHAFVRCVGSYSKVAFME